MGAGEGWKSVQRETGEGGIARAGETEDLDRLAEKQNQKLGKEEREAREGSKTRFSAALFSPFGKGEQQREAEASLPKPSKGPRHALRRSTTSAYFPADP